MSTPETDAKKKTGFVLLSIVVMCWIAVPVLPFFHFPHKVLVITVILVSGEVLFVAAIALLGQEYWGRIKTAFRRFFKRSKKSPEAREAPAVETDPPPAQNTD